MTRMLFASTGGAVYGDFVTPPNVETYAKDPESPYGIAKFATELYLAYYARVHKLDYIALRFANVYGPRQDPHGEAGVVATATKRPFVTSVGLMCVESAAVASASSQTHSE